MNHAPLFTGHRRRGSPATARAVAAVIAIVSLGLLAAACGSSGPPPIGVASLPSPSAASATPASVAATPDGSGQVAQAIAYAECMRSNGVPSWPDPDSRGAFDKTKLTLQQLGVTDAELQAGETACRDLLPNGGSGPTQSQLQQSRAQALEFAQCMRSNGVSTFPDPDQTGRIPDPGSRGLNQGAPQFQAANDACADYRPGYFPSNSEYDTWAATHGSGGPGQSTGAESSQVPSVSSQP